MRPPLTPGGRGRILEGVLLTFVRRLSAVCVALTLAVGGPAVCAGWLPTPEARMACCTSDGSCSMHKAESHADHSAQAVTQAEADRCCATSDQDDATPTPSATAFVVSLALVPSPVPVVLADAPIRADAWRTAVPISVTRVPRHLLLSVFLV
jgi:hypothetical protein